MVVPPGNRPAVPRDWIRGVPERYVAGADTRGRQEGRPYPWSQQDIHETSGLDTKGRFIPCTAQVVWSEERNLSDQRRFLGIGVRFTSMMLHDREFLYGEISEHI